MSGLGIEGIISTIGMLSVGKSLNPGIREENLIQGLMCRFSVSKDKAKMALHEAVEVKAIIYNNKTDNYFVNI